MDEWLQQVIIKFSVSDNTSATFMITDKSLISRKGRPKFKGIQSPGQITACNKQEWKIESEEKGQILTYCTRDCLLRVTPVFEIENSAKPLMDFSCF